MVTAGNIEIGGTINVQGIEVGLTRVENSLEDVATAGKSVNSDFVRMNQQAGRLGKTMGILAITGATAMIAISKGAPATAAAMARISISAMHLRFAIGEAMAEDFDKFAETLNNFAGWVDRNPDLFGGIVKSLLIFTGATAVLTVGGFVYKAWKGFFGVLKGIVAWTGWSKLFGNLSKLGKVGTGSGAGITASMGLTGIIGAIALPALIETYRTGAQPGDKLFQEEKAQFQKDLLFYSKVGTEREKKILRRLFGEIDITNI